MSDNEVKKEKVVTKYDLKMQRRQAEKEREQRQKNITKVVGVVIVVALIALIASFPIRTYVANHQTFITINGEKITQAEFDYNYNNVVNDYMNQYGAYLGYFGLDTTQDLSTQMYTDTLTWQDYFEEMTVDNMKRTKALKEAADAAGYTFDADEEVAEFKDALKDAAESAGVSRGKYVKQLYGQYATMGSISKYIAESARVNAYFEEISKDMKASDDEISAYYQENTDSYDSVDYYVNTYPAELSENPSDEETAAAMDAARELAEAAEENIMTEGGKLTNVKMADASYLISDWLFDEARGEGDTTVIEDESNNMYYVLGFIQRYLDETPTADVRVIMTQEMDGQTILDEWAAGEATEESFAELCNKYSADNGQIAEGGLLEGVTATSISSDMAAWIFAEGRKTGDTDYVTTEEGYTYVMYYVGQGDPEWKQSIADTLLSQAQSEYMTSLSENVVVEDPKGNLNYLKVHAEEEAAAASEEEAEGENGEGADTADGAEGTDGAESSEAAESAETTESSQEAESSQAQ